MTFSAEGQEDDLLIRGLGPGTERTAIFDDEGGHPFPIFDRKISQFGDWIGALGLRPGHRLAIILPAGSAMLALLIASLRRRLLVTILSPSLGPAMRRRRLSIFQADWIIDDHSALLREGSLPTLGPPGDLGGKLVLWTSGSTGQPRGVVLDWSSLLWNARTNASVLGLRESDRALVLLDGAYCYALVHQILSHIMVGGAGVVLRQPVWLEATGRFIERWQATTLAVVPSVLRTLLELPRIAETLGTLRMISIGGAAADEQLLQRAQQALPKVQLVVTYGLTEAGPRVCTRFYHLGEPEEPGLVGQPLPGVEVTIADDGELLVRSPSARAGDLDERGFSPAPEWVETGDIGRIESDGSVRILGRRKLLINRGGAKLIPDEIERIIKTCPGVANARVVAVPHRRLGEVPKAYVLPMSGAKPVPAELARRCTEQLGPAWVPASFEIVSELPRAGLSWKDSRSS